MQAPHLRQIGVGEDVAVQDEQSPRDQVGGIADTAAGPERLLLDDVPETDAEVLGVTEGGAHVVDAVGAREDDVRDAVGPQQGELIREEGAIQERNHGLRARERQGTQTRSLAAGQNDRLQGMGSGHYLPGDQASASLMSITGIPSRIG